VGAVHTYLIAHTVVWILDLVDRGSFHGYLPVLYCIVVYLFTYRSNTGIANFHTRWVLVLDWYVPFHIPIWSWYWTGIGPNADLCRVWGRHKPVALRSVDIRLVLTQRTYQSGIGIRLVLPQLIPNWYVLSYPQYIPELILYPGCSLNTRLLFFIIYMHDMYPLICTPNIICIPIHITFFSLHFFSGCRWPQ